MENKHLHKIKDNKIEVRKGLFKKSFFFLLVILLMSISFFAGMYLVTKNSPAENLAKEANVYLGSVLGKYSENDNGLLSQNIDFSLFWEVWDQLEKNT